MHGWVILMMQLIFLAHFPGAPNEPQFVRDDWTEPYQVQAVHRLIIDAPQGCFVLDFRFVASFWNEGDSDATIVESRGQSLHFPSLPLKNRGSTVLATYLSKFLLPAEDPSSDICFWVLMGGNLPSPLKIGAVQYWQHIWVNFFSQLRTHLLIYAFEFWWEATSRSGRLVVH